MTLIPDRINGPVIHSEYNIDIPPFERNILSNALRVFEVNAGTQDILKFDLVFKVGRVHETRRASAKASFYLMREGSVSKNSEELAYIFDFYGAYVKIFSGLEYSSVSIVCMTRHFENVWPHFIEMILNPSYNEEELLKYSRVNSQRLNDQLSKNDIIAYRALTEKLFGTNHPYGYNTQPEDIRSLERKHLLEFHEKNHGISEAFVILSGKYPVSLSDKIMADLSKIRSISNPKTQGFKEEKSQDSFLRITTNNQVQTSLKIGRKLFSRKHSDFSRVQVLNTILGGYFGSRLMKNIREDKGFTYGIYSSVDTWKRDGFFYISADLGNDFVREANDEIYKEIDKLKSDLVPYNEFSMVKNYMLGQILHLVDGPFATGQLIKSIYAKDLDIEHFKNHIETIKSMTRKEVMEMAQKYLEKNTLTTVLAGNF
ncbi:MAG: insulinase family protein [Bacteroidia bacterium]|nr:insulinase family protein [Bacteroidia bacterium]MBT8230012.1 insulinase family protein [Bacteroidia bacterium]